METSALRALLAYGAKPEPWSEGGKIPWHEPGFSRRMLREHLTQLHGRASRRRETIDRHVAWIHAHSASGRPGRVLDLGCGPGLYLERLAALGHECVGIDFSPASIAYARERAQESGRAIRYVEEDVREADFGRGFDLVMLLFGEFNAFRREESRDIVLRARAALVPGGCLLVEPHPFEAVHAMGQEPRFWAALPAGLFSDTPYLWLSESVWDEDTATATTRHLVLEEDVPEPVVYCGTSQAWRDDELRALLDQAGFGDVERHPSLGVEKEDLCVWLARAA